MGLNQWLLTFRRHYSLAVWCQNASLERTFHMCRHILHTPNVTYIQGSLDPWKSFWELSVTPRWCSPRSRAQCPCSRNVCRMNTWALPPLTSYESTVLSAQISFCLGTLCRQKQRYVGKTLAWMLKAHMRLPTAIPLPYMFYQAPTMYQVLGILCWWTGWTPSLRSWSSQSSGSGQRSVPDLGAERGADTALQSGSHHYFRGPWALLPFLH